MPPVLPLNNKQLNLLSAFFPPSCYSWIVDIHFIETLVFVFKLVFSFTITNITKMNLSTGRLIFKTKRSLMDFEGCSSQSPIEPSVLFLPRP